MQLATPAVVSYWVDGGCLGHANPSPVGVYWSAYESTGGKEDLVIKRKQSLDHFTNNEAEYLGLKDVLAYAFVYHPEKIVRIYSDSQLIVNQFNKRWACRDTKLVPLLQECLALASLYTQELHLSWVRRAEMVRRLGH